MLAVAEKMTENFKEFFFIIKPSLGDRKVHLVRHESHVMIEKMTFVTNEHTLIQFKSSAVPIKEEDGSII